jgi:hypothetical protein
MKNLAKSLVAAVGILAISITGSVAQDGNVTNVNGNYKHQMPVSTEHTFASNFTKPEKESLNRNYKQQNQEKRNVKFKEHFTKPAKIDSRNSKHPYGL